jgi:endonuclease/exonuclease/phosphatase family metal-dependent hydrolase
MNLLERIAATTLLVLLCGCASAPPAGTSIRVLVFNIHAGKDSGGIPNLEWVAALVRTSNADIALFQEVDRGTKRSGNIDQVGVLANLTRFSAAFGRSLDYDGGVYGIAALSREPMVTNATEPLPIEPPQARAGGAYEPRVALTFRTPTRLGPLQAINTHLDASRDENYRLQESARIAALTRKMTDPALPLIVGGDFNAEPGSGTYAQLIAAGLRDAWKECGAGDGFTYPAIKPIKRIDYLFLTAGLRCTRAEVLDSTASDHRPLLVTLTRQ